MEAALAHTAQPQTLTPSRLSTQENRILDAALKLFVDERWLDITVTDIAREANIGKGTVYRYFPSKEDLYLRLALRHQEGLAAALSTIDTDDPSVRLRNLLKAWWTVTTEPSPYRRLVLYGERPETLVKVSAMNRARWQRVARTIDRPFEESLTQLAWQGRLDGAGDPARAVRLLAALLTGARDTLWQDPDGREHPGRDYQDLERFVLTGFLKDTADTGAAAVAEVPALSPRRTASGAAA